MTNQRYLFSKKGFSAFKSFCGDKILWSFDLDGTLVPIVDDFQKVKLDPLSRRCLIELSQKAPVVILSGRSRRDLKTLVPIRSVKTVGNHGLEGVPSLLHQNGDHTHYQRRVREWVHRLTAALLHLKGVFVEDKKISMTIHFRNAPQRAHAKKIILHEILSLDPGPRIVFGKAVFNLLPSQDIHKGTALLELMKKADCPRAFFIGDDITDEDVFHLKKKNIFGVRVGRSKKSEAKYFLHSQREVLRLLKILTHLN